MAFFCIERMICELEIERDADMTMSQQFLHDFQVYLHAKEDACRAVAQICSRISGKPVRLSTRLKTGENLGFTEIFRSPDGTRFGYELKSSNLDSKLARYYQAGRNGQNEKNDQATAKKFLK